MKINESDSDMLPDNPAQPGSAAASKGTAKQKRDRTVKRIVYLLIIVSCLFLSLIFYLTYFKLAVGDKIVTNPYNRRQWEKENSTIRGSITDRNGVVLAKSIKVSGKNVRVYPYKSLYSHIIGYNSRSYGRTLLEAQYNDYLLGNTGVGSVFNIAAGAQGGYTGDSLQLTIDNRLQSAAADLLGGRQGAIVAMDPTTGEILAMVSKPDFDPNADSLSAKWQELVESDSHPFFPRATQGLYTPGSTFKIITAAAAIDNGLENRTYYDKGTITIDGKVFSNSGKEAHGSLNLKSAFAVSSNTYFAGLGVELGSEKIGAIAEKMGFNSEIPFDIPLKKSTFPTGGMKVTKAGTAAAAIGQGKDLVTPLQMALVTSCMANDGIVMQPKLVKRILSPKGKVIKVMGPEVYGRAVDEVTAGKVAEAMREVVVSGTGRKAAIRGINVAGKTGTAQNELSTAGKGAEHAWFTCFAPYENPKIVVTVILEYNGSVGGETAAPIAAKLIKEYMSYQR